MVNASCILCQIAPEPAKTLTSAEIADIAEFAAKYGMSYSFALSIMEHFPLIHRWIEKWIDVPCLWGEA